MAPLCPTIENGTPQQPTTDFAAALAFRPRKEPADAHSIQPGDERDARAGLGRLHCFQRPTPGSVEADPRSQERSASSATRGPLSRRADQALGSACAIAGQHLAPSIGRGWTPDRHRGGPACPRRAVVQACPSGWQSRGRLPARMVGRRGWFPGRRRLRVSRLFASKVSVGRRTVV